jgi:hypothetical protein
MPESSANLPPKRTMLHAMSPVAAFLTLKTGGSVWVVEGDEFPADAEAVAAVLRYPSPVDGA